MSDRVYEVLRARAAGKAEDWLLPSARSQIGYLMDLGKQFRMARRKAQLSEDLVLYCGRHDYGTRVVSNTGNLAPVMRTMGHKEVRAASSISIQTEIVRAVLNRTKWIVHADDRIGQSAKRLESCRQLVPPQKKALLLSMRRAA